MGKEGGTGENKELKGTARCNSVAEASTQETGEEIWAHILYLPVNALTSKPLGGVFLIPKYLAAYDFSNKAFTIGTHVLTGQNRTLLFHFYAYLIQANFHRLQRKHKILQAFSSHIFYGCVYIFVPMHALACPRVLLHRAFRPTPGYNMPWLMLGLWA